MHNHCTLTALLGAVLLIAVSGSSDISQTNSATHVPRQLATCDAGKYSSTCSGSSCSGSISSSCSGSSCPGSTCSIFGMGGFCIGTWSTSTSWSTVPSCENCAQGKHQDTAGQSSCKDCSAGQYAAGTTNTACTVCAAGKVTAVDGSGSCPDCSAGQYQDQESQTECIDCAKGMYEANRASLACTDCATGQHQDEDGQTLCKDCATGKYADVTGLTDCKECPTGYFEPDTAEAVGCDECPVGYFQNTIAQAKCDDCVVGRYNPYNHSSSCLRCAAGKAHALTTQIEESSCENCPAGYYSHDSDPSNSADHAESSNGQHGTCRECPAGQFQSKPGQITCNDCDWGKYNENTAGSTADSCKPCQAGRFSEQDRSTGMIDTAPNGAGILPDPNVNDTNAHDGYDECPVCPKGYYQDLQGQHICLATDPGYFTKTDESTSQTPCSAGHFNTKKGCQDCVGLTSGPDKTDITCLDSTTCDDTTKDANNIYNRGTETCLGIDKIDVNEGDCPVAHYQPDEGQTSCIASAAGQYATKSRTSNADLYDNADHIDHQGQTNQKACPAGKYNWQNGAMRNTHDGTKPKPYHHEQWKNHYGVSDYLDECIDCPTGKYQPEDGQTSCLITKPGTYQNEVGQTSAICTRAGTFQPQNEAPINAGGDNALEKAAIAAKMMLVGGYQDDTDPRYVGASAEHDVNKIRFGPIGRMSTDEVACAPGYVSSPCMAYCSPDPALICAYGFGFPAGLIVLLIIVEELLRKCKRQSVLRTPQSEYLTLLADDDEKGLKKGEKILKTMNMGMLVWSAIPQKDLLRPYLGGLRKKCGIVTSKDPPDFNIIPPQPEDTWIKQTITHLKNKHELLYIFATPKNCKFWALRRLVIMLFQIFFVIGVNIVLYFASGAAHPDCLSPEMYESKFGSVQVCSIAGNCDCPSPAFANENLRAVIASLVIMPVTALAKWGLADLGPMFPRGNDPKRGRVEYYLRYWGMFQLTMGLFVACTVLLNLAIAEGEVDLLNASLVAIPITWAVGALTSVGMYVVAARMFFTKPDPAYTKLKKWNDLKAGGKIEPAKPLTVKQFFASLCACTGAEVVPITNDMPELDVEAEAADVDANETEDGAFEALPAEISGVLTGFAWMTPALLAVMKSIAAGDKPGARTNFGKYILSLANLPDKVVGYCTPLIIAAATGDKEAAKQAVGTVVSSELNERLTIGDGGKHLIDVAVWTVAGDAELKKKALVALLETQLSQEPLNAPEPVVKLIVAGATDGAEGVKTELQTFVESSLKTSDVPEVVHGAIVAAVAGDEDGVKDALKEAMVATVKQELEGQEGIPETVHPLILCAVKGDKDGAKEAAEALTKSELESAGVPSEIIELVEAAIAGTFEEKAKAIAKDYVTKKLTDQGVPEAVVALVLAGAEGDMGKAKETATNLIIETIATALADKNVNEKIIELVKAGLSQDSAKVEEICIDVVVAELLVGQMNVPEELVPLMKAVASRSQEDAEKEAAALVTAVVKPSFEEALDEAGCDARVANLIVCCIMKDKEGAKAVMLDLVSSALENEGEDAEVVLNTIKFVVANQDRIREYLIAAVKSHNNQQEAAAATKATAVAVKVEAEPEKVDAPSSPTKALPPVELKKTLPPVEA